MRHINAINTPERGVMHHHGRAEKCASKREVFKLNSQAPGRTRSRVIVERRWSSAIGLADG